MNFENAIRGARNPMNSWGRMDSGYDEDGNFVLGPNDRSLAIRKPFSIDDFSHDHMTPETLEFMNQMVEYLEKVRNRYLETKSKEDWYDMIQLLPSSYNQMRTCTMNYESLINMYFARRNHKLAEWHTFCDWIMTLPYAKELIAAEEDEEA